MDAGLFFLTPLVVAAGGVAFETLGQRRDRRRFPAPGRMVDIEGHRLHVRVLGRGDPVIVLEGGAGEWSSHWEPLLGKLSDLSTVVAYDRAGLGWSDPIPNQRSAENQTRELRQLLRTVAGERRFLLVGHSTGARVLRLFAHRYPLETAGLIFVDGYHEDLETELASAGVPSPRVSAGVLQLLTLAGRLGLLRLIGRSLLAPGMNQLGLRKTLLATIETLARSPGTLATIQAEELASDTSDAQVRCCSLDPSLPIKILIAQQTLSAEGVPRAYPRDDYNRVWREVSGRLGGAGGASSVGIIKDQDHLFPFRTPQLVLDAVEQLLEQLRQEVADG